MKKKSFIYGALILTLASLISKVLGAVFRIPLTSLIGAEGIGIYQLVFPIYALFLVASSSGVPVSLSKIISRENSKENYFNIKVIFKASLNLMLLLGIFFTIIIIFISKILAGFQSNVSIYICYIAIAPAILFSTVISAFRGYFQGLEIMKFSAISQILEQIFKLVFGLLFAFLFIKINLIMAVLGAVLGFSLSELITVIYLFFCYKIHSIKSEDNAEKVLKYNEAYKLIIKEAVPITLSSIIVPLASFVDSLIIIKLLENIGFSFEISSSLYGLESGVVASLISLPSVIAVSLAISLMPSISSSFALKRTKDVEFKSKLGVKIVWYFTIPCAILFLLNSTEICYFLYRNLNTDAINGLKIASLMLKVSSITIIYGAINQVLTTILQAVNRSYVPVFVSLFATILKLILTIILVSIEEINIYGLVFADTISMALASVVNLAFIRKNVKLNFEFKEMFLVPLISGFFLVLTNVVLKYLLSDFLESRIAVLLILGASFCVYLIFVVLLKGFNNKEINKTTILKFFKKKKL